MRHTSALHRTLLVALLASCSQPPSGNGSIGEAAIEGPQKTAHEGGSQGQPLLTDPEPHPLEGYWEENGDSGTVSMTIAGDSLYFYRREDFQYDTTFTLAPDTDPPELHATILDSPRTTDSAGELVVAIYELEEDTLKIAVVDKVDGVPASFDDAIDRYRFERTEPRK